MGGYYELNGFKLFDEKYRFGTKILNVYNLDKYCGSGLYC